MPLLMCFAGVLPFAWRAKAFVFAIIFSGCASAQTVDVVEFYNASQDHYFISALAGEIAALDTGQFPGWVRTGMTFRA